MRLIVSVLALWLASLPIDGDDAPTPGLCLTLWQRADLDGDGVLDGREATPYLAMMHLHRTAPPRDGRIERPLFMAACRTGGFRTGFTPD
jgi:hypothetical protein